MAIGLTFGIEANGTKADIGLLEKMDHTFGTETDGTPGENGPHLMAAWP